MKSSSSNKYKNSLYKKNKNTKRRLNRKKRPEESVKGAKNQLKRFKQASILAVGITGLMLMFTSSAPSESFDASSQRMRDTTTETLKKSNEQAADEAIGALHNMWESFIYNYPKVLIALACLVLAWLIMRLVKYILKITLKNVPSAGGIITLSSIFIWLLAIGVVFSIVAGDIRALIGSFGLIGLALSWALQTPIESFTGWLLNSFKRYYKIGDRIRVGEVFGDVYKIDFLATTVWEIGSPFQPGFVNAEQPTGRLVTFPNNEILSGTIINLTGDFPFVWDELVMPVANESEISTAIKVMEDGATEVLGKYMATPARNYSTILQRAGLDDNVPQKPMVFVSASDSWTELTIRYLVGARERRRWKSDLLIKLSGIMNKPEYKNKIIPVYPRQQVQFITSDGISHHKPG